MDQYSKTPTTDFYLDLWVPPLELSPKPTDKQIKLEPKYHRRPDKLAKDLYGNERYWWVFSVRNKDILIDPFNDFKAGVIIFVPASL